LINCYAGCRVDVDEPALSRALTTLIVAVATVLFVAFGDLAGFGPPEFPSVRSVFSTSYRVPPPVGCSWDGKAPPKSVTICR
jgi:hypothetical protein